MPGDLAGGVEAGNGSAVAQHARAVVGREPAASIPAILPNTKARSTDTAFGAVP